MNQKVLKIDDLNPDGVGISVNWDAMEVGYSVFVPLREHGKSKRTGQKCCKNEILADRNASFRRRW